VVRIAVALVTVALLASVGCDGDEDLVTVPDEVASFVAFVETPHSTTTGFHFRDGWVITSASAIWPHREVRVVLNDGTEAENAPVQAWDRIADLAVIRVPDGHLAAAPEYPDSESVPEGSALTLVGFEDSTRGNSGPMSSSGRGGGVSEWQAAALRYLQFEPLQSEKPSGGILVTNDGSVSGFLGRQVGDGPQFALTSSSAVARATDLIADLDVVTHSLRHRFLARNQNDFPFEFELIDFYQNAFVIHAPVGEQIEVDFAGSSDLSVAAYDIGGRVIAAGHSDRGDVLLSFEAETEGPFVVVATQDRPGHAGFEVAAKPGIAIQNDDDEGRLVTFGSYIGNIDFPTDVDISGIRLAAGTTITVRVESASVDARVAIDTSDDTREPIEVDDDSGGGVFGADAELTYAVPADGTYFIVVSAEETSTTGGYILTIE
jgi:hypothetical protein